MPNSAETDDAWKSRARFRKEALKGFLWEFSSIDLVKKCGNIPRSKSGVGLVVLPSRDGSSYATWVGRLSCHSVHCCPWCQSRISYARAAEIRQAMTRWSRRGGHCVLLTLNIGHRAHHGLDDVWDAVSIAWRDLLRHNAFKKHRTNGTGLAGFTRVAETTHGKNGWHVHLHVLLYVDHALPIMASMNNLFSVWSKIVTGHGFACNPALQDLRPAHVEDAEVISGYVTKSKNWDAADEVARQGAKSGRLNHETPMDILWRAYEGDADALKLWHVWERHSRGRRQITWSQGHRRKSYVSLGIRQALGMGIEQDDATVVEESPARQIAGIPPERYKWFRENPEAMVEFLEVAETTDASSRDAALEKIAQKYELPLVVGKAWRDLRFQVEQIGTPRHRRESQEHFDARRAREERRAQKLGLTSQQYQERSDRERLAQLQRKSNGGRGHGA